MLVKGNSDAGRAEVSVKGRLETKAEVRKDKAEVRRDPRGPNIHVAPPMLCSYGHAPPPPQGPPLCVRTHTLTTHQAAATLSHPIKLVLPVYLCLKRKYVLNSNVP